MISKHKCIIFQFTNLLYKVPLEKECKSYFQVHEFSEVLEGVLRTKDTKTNQPEPSLPSCIIHKTSQDQTDLAGLKHCSDPNAQWSNGGTGQVLGKLGRSLMTNPWPCSEKHHNRTVWPQPATSVQLLCSLVCKDGHSFALSSPQGAHSSHSLGTDLTWGCNAKCKPITFWNYSLK